METLCYFKTAICFFITFFLGRVVLAEEWPVSYRRYSLRPQSSQYCKAGVIPFCPTGEPANLMPQFKDDDEIEIYALKKPVWQFKFGDTLGLFNIMHDALGFKDVKSGLNFTMEWYELFQLMNCTFAHVPNNSIQWCNQGAACIYPGIKDRLWKENGTLAKIATVSGTLFNKFSDWVMWDNRTGLFYETWTVKEKPGGKTWFSPSDYASWVIFALEEFGMLGGKTWFSPFDCASWVIRALEEFGMLGAKFNQSVHLNYTKINLYSETPIYLGNSSEIFGSNANKTMKKYGQDIIAFYKNFQSKKSYLLLVAEILDDLVDIFVNHKPFYLYYNDAYWLLNLVKPIAKLTYEETPLPKPGQYELDSTLRFQERD